MNDMTFCDVCHKNIKPHQTYKKNHFEFCEKCMFEKYQKCNRCFQFYEIGRTCQCQNLIMPKQYKPNQIDICAECQQEITTATYAIVDEKKYYCEKCFKKKNAYVPEKHLEELTKLIAE